jgi:hypothetical protein
MEQIVKKNKELSWIGWDVVERKRSDIAKTSASGVRVKDFWYIQKVFSVNRNGWDIPNKYGH